MASAEVTRIAMMQDLGQNVVNSFTLDATPKIKPGYASTYEPPSNRVVMKTDATKRVSKQWKLSIRTGQYNDSDAATVNGLADFGGPRAHDKSGRRLQVSRPDLEVKAPAPSMPGGAITSPPSTSSMPGGADTGPPSTSSTTRDEFVSRAVTRSPLPSSIGEGAKTSCVVRLPPTPGFTGATSTRSQELNGVHQAESNPGDTLPVSAPSRGPPTPAASPTAPTSGSSGEKPSQPVSSAPATASLPKPSLGLGASRWAIGPVDQDAEVERRRKLRQASLASSNSPTTESQPQGPVQAPSLEVTTPTSETKIPAFEAKIPQPPQAVKIPASEATLTETSQTTPPALIAQDPIIEATMALSKLTIENNDMEAPKTKITMDPLTDKPLDPREFVSAAKARVSVDGFGKTICGLYLNVKNQNCPVFEVVYQDSILKATQHSVLHMLSRSRGGVFLELAFILDGNQIKRYSLEFKTDQIATEFLDAMEWLRQATWSVLSEEVEYLVRGSCEAILKQNTRSGFTPSLASITTVKYPFGGDPPSPSRKKSILNSGARCTDTPQGILIPQIVDASPQSQQRTYTQDELVCIGRDKAATSMLMVNDDFLQAVRVIKRTCAGKVRTTTPKPLVHQAATSMPLVHDNLIKAEGAVKTRHKKSDSEECVVGVMTEDSSSMNEARSSAMLGSPGSLGRMVSDANSWAEGRL